MEIDRLSPETARVEANYPVAIAKCLYGPYLSMAAATLLFVWPVLWVKWAAMLFETLCVIFWWILGVNVAAPH